MACIDLPPSTNGRFIFHIMKNIFQTPYSSTKVHKIRIAAFIEQVGNFFSGMHVYKLFSPNGYKLQNL